MKKIWCVRPPTTEGVLFIKQKFGLDIKTDGQTRQDDDDVTEKMDIAMEWRIEKDYKNLENQRHQILNILEKEDFLFDRLAQLCSSSNNQSTKFDVHWRSIATPHPTTTSQSFDHLEDEELDIDL